MMIANHDLPLTAFCRAVGPLSCLLGIPLLREMVQAHFGGKALCASINADECVAHGAAVLAAQRIDGSKAIKLKDVAPLSIGIGVKGGIIKV
jgi:L1 cell adhesion molecule like protein